jgi:hypothetical protein
VSRLSVITGIHRKEVKRLAKAPDLGAVRAESTPAAQLFTRWMTDANWRGPDGRPRVLPRRGTAGDPPGFEELARSVTTDVHPRTLLDELLRLGLVDLDPERDRVRLRADAFVPAQRLEALLAFLGANVGDHLAAARANVAARLRDAAVPPGRAPFVEQALFADALSSASAALAGESARSVLVDAAVGARARAAAARGRGPGRRPPRGPPGADRPVLLRRAGVRGAGRSAGDRCAGPEAAR